jgi:putative phosphoesterase
MRLGIVSDTHGLFDRALLRHLAGVDRILHAGDIGGQTVMELLETIAPVTAVSGNVDGFEASGVPIEQVLLLEGRRIAIYHRLYERGRLTQSGRDFLDRVRPDVCVYGHTHQPKAEWQEGVLMFNPGSAGPKRFRLPRAMGLLLLHHDRVEPQHIFLPDQAERS